MTQLKVKKLHENAIIPIYQTSGASAFDLHILEDVTIKPGQTVLIPLGLAFDIPDGFEIQIRPRSGVSLKTDLLIKNSPGTIDKDYTGEVKLIIKNNAYLSVDEDNNIVYPEAVTIEKGTRLAQAVLCNVIQADIVEVTEIKDTERSSGGFGHTGSN